MSDARQRRQMSWDTSGDGGILLDDGVAEGYSISRLASLISQKKKKKKKKKKKTKKRFCRTSDLVNLSHHLASTSSLYPALFQDNDTFGFLIESPVRIVDPIALLLRFNAWFLTESVPVA